MIKKTMAKSEIFVKKNWVDILLILIIFLIGFSIRLINLRYGLQTDELKWIFRAKKFIWALYDLNPSGTMISNHPGVTTMYLTGFVYFLLPENLDILSYSRLPFCILGAATCSLIYLMGSSIFNRERGFLAAVMLTFEPFYIGITRIVHLDGLLSFFFTLTLYFFWLGITKKKQIYTVFSGISLGLAVLTKGFAIFLIPILVIWLWLLKNNAELKFWQSTKLMIKILLIGGLIFFILWPGVWNLQLAFDKLNKAISKLSSGHDLPIFFLGSTSWPNNAAPFYFYPIILMIRLSTGVLICFLISVTLYVHKMHKKKVMLEETLLLIATVFFIIGISIFSKKLDRYLIPIWPILMLFSSDGFHMILSSTRTLWNSFGRFKNWQIAPNVIISFVIVFPAAFWCYNFQPFYVFYFNDFVGGLNGGSKITTTYTSEGTRLVAEYLSSKSDQLVVACAYADKRLNDFYKGEVTPLPQSLNALLEKYDYVVFHLTYVQRYHDNIIWQQFKDKNPEWVVIVQEVTVVWVFNTTIITI